MHAIVYSFSRQLGVRGRVREGEQCYISYDFSVTVSVTVIEFLIFQLSYNYIVVVFSVSVTVMHFHFQLQLFFIKLQPVCEKTNRSKVPTQT